MNVSTYRYDKLSNTEIRRIFLKHVQDKLILYMTIIDF